MAFNNRKAQHRIERSTHIDVHSPTECVGASILLYAIDPIFHNAYILLARDALVPNQWSDFGGKKMYTNEQPHVTAAREFWEETCGCVFRYFSSSKEEELPMQTHHTISNSLRRGFYTFKFTFKLTASDTLKSNGQHRKHLKKNLRQDTQANKNAKT